MVNKLTRRLIGILAMMVLMMTTSLSVNAVSYYIAGDFTNWGTGKVEMTSDGQGQWVLPAQNVTAGQKFKVVKVDSGTETWYGYTDYHVNDYVVSHGTPIDVYVKDLQNNDQGDLDFQVSGVFRFVLVENGDHPQVTITYVPQPVTVKSGITNGTVTVDPTQALPGATVTITADPADDEFGNDDYYIDVDHIKVEKTVVGDVAQTPGLKADGPGVGSTVNVVAGEAANTFTFAMPESPYGAQVSAEFQARIQLTEAMFKPIPDKDLTGTQITPTVECAEGYDLELGTDYTVEYGENIGPGQNAGIVSITGIGKYKGSVTLFFTIKQGIHNVNITTDNNGTVVAEPASAVQGTSIVLTITPNNGYELDKLIVDGVDKTSEVSNNTYTFTMPDADVVVNATFTKVPALYLTGTFNNWSQDEEDMLALQTNDQGKWVCTQEMGAGDTFKFKDENGAWIGATGNGACVVTYEFVKNKAALEMTTPGQDFTIPVAGTWTFTVDRDANPMTVTISGDWYFNITVETPTNGSVTVKDDKTKALEGDEVELIITPVAGYQVGTITVKDANNNPVTVTNNKFEMPAADVTVTVIFVKDPALYLTGTFNNWSQDEEDMLALQTNDQGKWVCTQEMGAGDTFKFKDENGAWIGATGNGACVVTYEFVKNKAALEMTTPGQDFTIPVAGTWTFTVDRDANPMTVTISGDWYFNITVETPTNGSVTVKDDKTKALEGDEVELIITPVAGYQVGTITVKDANNNPVTVTNNKFEMPAADVTVAVTFTKILTNNPLTWNVVNASLEVKVGEGEAATPIQSGTEVQEGSEVNVTITQTDAQAAEWTISKVTIVYGTTTTEITAVDGVYTFEMPAAATEIKVEFTAVKHNITVTPNDYVTVVVDPTTAAAGDEVTITVTPNDDFVVTGVTVNDGDVEVTDNGDGTYTFDMPTGANGVTIDVTVAAKIQGVSFTADRNWATYIGAYDLVKPAGVEAIYVVTGVQSNAVVIEEVNYIPANKGVLLFSETAGENLVAELYTGDKDATISTKLVGNATAATNVTIEDYVLYNNNFIRSEEGTVAAHRCYLPGSVVLGNPRMLKIGYYGDVPTAIESLMAEGNVANVMYVNMSGLTSDKPFRGINIAVVTFTDGSTKTIKLVK